MRQHCAEIINKLPSHRLMALDVMRGLTITAMILVNNPGSWGAMYWPLKHAQWHGWTPTDLIFPFFIFIVGMSITLSVNSLRARGVSDQHILKAGVIRTIKLIALGWFLALFYYNFRDPSFSWLDDKLLQLRVLGVLQRIGLVYLVALCCYLYLSPKKIAITCIALLFFYGAAMLYIPYTLPNGEVVSGLWLHGNNLSAFIDNAVLGSHHLYYANAKPLPFDPEGLFSTLPAIASALSGMLAAVYLTKQPDLKKQARTLILLGTLAVIAGYAISPITPINKALWTPSYVLLSSGLAAIFYALCSAILDIYKLRNWGAPFIVFGANAILFFMFAGVFARLLIMIPLGDSSLKGNIYGLIQLVISNDYLASFSFSLLFLVVSYGVMYSCYRKGIFWKV